MADTVRGCIFAEDSGEWYWRIFVPSEAPGFPAEAVDRYLEYCKAAVYDLPRELVDEFTAAVEARDKVDQTLAEIVKTGKGKVNDDGLRLPDHPDRP